MIVVTRIKQRNIDSSRVSLPQELISSYIQNVVHEVEVRCKETDQLLEKYNNKELEELMGSAIANGKNYTKNGQYYYLGNRK